MTRGNRGNVADQRSGKATQEEPAFEKHYVCFFDDRPAHTILLGIPLCASHATCQTCFKPVTKDVLTCQCDKDGYGGHEESLWCSEPCREQAHAGPDWDDQELPDDAEEAGK